ncbi:YsnF/AvaK domain-containing protein [Belnapia moabensis]|uniref:YsnF/AvaK domain-containing protein n=1 Tax=Belnapia moabensis TaxID=365533 RepID=UPI000694E3C0|nr:YsnF/AvaK domain-containing protein [Belnapia moabensis]
MTQNITAYFDTVQSAQKAADNLAQQVSGVRAEVYDSTTSSRLTALSLPQEDAASMAEGFRRGGGVVHAEVPEGRFDEVANVLEASGAIDLSTREEEWRREGWTGGSASPTAVSSAGTTHAGSGAVERLGAAPDEARIPVVEERLSVGKREITHGRVRIRSYVVETPVQEQVTLHQEHVDVQRRTVDRPVTGADAALFQERTIEATETAEEAVISKEARIKEELVVRKTADERTQSVTDTVRRTEVEVEDDRIPGAPSSTVGKTTTRGPNAV